jgi:hypothetical protein
VHDIPVFYQECCPSEMVLELRGKHVEDVHLVNKILLLPTTTT